jgi:ADP-ribosyl-[dinitrogen reductase] hydrolase
MRTAPVALAYLHDPIALAEAARAISALTHFDEDAADACVLWSLATRHAVLTGKLDARTGIEALPAERREKWSALLEEAEKLQPRDFDHNGWVVQALQGAWSSIHHARVQAGNAPAAPIPAAPIPAAVLRDALERAVRGGRDTDTVAAIAGGLLGGALGASAVPSAWSLLVHGWPGLTAAHLIELAVLAGAGGKPGSSGWPIEPRLNYSSFAPRDILVAHPHDDGVLLGAIGSLDAVLAGSTVDAVVSLCRIGPAQRRGADHVEIWLVDNPDPAKNPNLDAVLNDAADAVAAFRAQGKTVLLHCVQAQSRTPSVAALYAALHREVPIEQAVADVVGVLPDAVPQQFLLDAVRRISAERTSANPTAS